MKKSDKTCVIGSLPLCCVAMCVTSVFGASVPGTTEEPHGVIYDAYKDLCYDGPSMAKIYRDNEGNCMGMCLYNTQCAALGIKELHPENNDEESNIFECLVVNQTSDCDFMMRTFGLDVLNDTTGRCDGYLSTESGKDVGGGGDGNSSSCTSSDGKDCSEGNGDGVSGGNDSNGDGGADINDDGKNGVDDSDEDGDDGGIGVEATKCKYLRVRARKNPQ